MDTIYFGGGTPSLLPNECMELSFSLIFFKSNSCSCCVLYLGIDRILQRLRDTFTLDPLSEVTLEMDPGTFDYERLLALRCSGVNRISMGVQSFDSAMLKHCGRPHSVEDTYRAVEDLHRASWDNFSIDLISSLPHLTAELWQETLEKAAKVGSAHISVYDLQVEPGTAFARWYTPGVSPLPTEEVGAEMYRTAVRSLGAAGFEHYEVSNYAQPGKRSRHNLKYWQCAPVMAFGMSAASYWGNQRFSRPRTMPEYEQYVQSLQDQQQQYVQSAAAQDGTSGIPDIYDRIMLALRTADGLDLSAFRSDYGPGVTEKVVGALRGFTENGLVRLSGSAGGEPERARLSNPEGLLVSNDVISSVFAALPG